MYMYIYTRTHTHICICIYICICVYIYTHIYVYICIYIHRNIYSIGMCILTDTVLTCVLSCVSLHIRTLGNTGITGFIVLHIYCIFYKLNICAKSASSKFTGVIFPIVFSYFVSLCHILVILTIFQTFSLLLYFLW